MGVQRGPVLLMKKVTKKELDDTSLEKWNNDHVTTWLQTQGFAHFSKYVFFKGTTGKDLLDMKDGELPQFAEEMGAVHRIEFMSRFKALKKRRGIIPTRYGNSWRATKKWNDAHQHL